MSFLLDTNAVSEWTKPRPDPNVVTWFADVDEDRAFLSVATLAEIHRGVELLPPGARRNRLAEWVRDDLPERFDGRILPVDSELAVEWGGMMARARRAGLAIGSMDALLAATAAIHGLTLVTRNVADFAPLGVQLLNPWVPPA